MSPRLFHVNCTLCGSRSTAALRSCRGHQRAASPASAQHSASAPRPTTHQQLSSALQAEADSELLCWGVLRPGLCTAVTCLWWCYTSRSTTAALQRQVRGSRVSTSVLTAPGAVTMWGWRRCLSTLLCVRFGVLPKRGMALPRQGHFLKWLWLWLLLLLVAGAGDVTWLLRASTQQVLGQQSGGGQQVRPPAC